MDTLISYLSPIDRPISLMGMDVYGRRPQGENGTYFRANVWYWHPLWTYCEQIATHIIPDDNSGHMNDGWGLGAKKSRDLAALLRENLDNGMTAKYAEERQAALDALPDESCTICAGTGRRMEPPQIGAGDKPCNGCGETGKTRPFGTYYGFEVSFVREFADFLETCGGFNIH